MPRSVSALPAKLRDEDTEPLETIVTISGADRAGALAQILSLLARKGYSLKGQQIVESPGGSRLLKIRLDLAQLDKERLSAEIKTLNPLYEITDVGIEGDAKGARNSPAQATSALLKEMAAKFPDIVPLVQAYGGSLGAGVREAALNEAGRKIGGYHYNKEWSFGNPLKMPAALHRSLVPALEKFGVVEATDTEVRLPDSPFCGVPTRLGCCEFLAGFMQGFLDASPATKGVRVRKLTCRANGSPQCAYTFEAPI
jgi:predicted hydrocarbon binding protein